MLGLSLAFILGQDQTLFNLYVFFVVRHSLSPAFRSTSGTLCSDKSNSEWVRIIKQKDVSTDREGFEPPGLRNPSAFKADTLNHSDIHPLLGSSWSERIRTFESRYQKPTPYRLATLQCHLNFLWFWVF